MHNMDYRLKGHSVECCNSFGMVHAAQIYKRHELWQEPVRHGSEILAGTRSGILAGTPASRTSGIWADIRSWILAGIRAPLAPGNLAAICAGISAGIRAPRTPRIVSGIRPGTLAGIRAPRFSRVLGLSPGEAMALKHQHG